jgi:hypothetical protein
LSSLQGQTSYESLAVLYRTIRAVHSFTHVSFFRLLYFPLFRHTRMSRICTSARMRPVQTSSASQLNSQRRNCSVSIARTDVSCGWFCAAFPTCLVRSIAAIACVGSTLQVKRLCSGPIPNNGYGECAQLCWVLALHFPCCWLTDFSLFVLLCFLFPF